MRDSAPVSGSVAPIRSSETDGPAAAAVVPPCEGFWVWSVEDCLHAPSASAQRPETRVAIRMARYQNHFFLHCSSRVARAPPCNGVPWTDRELYSAPPCAPSSSLWPCPLLPAPRT